jgi:hypothetical protein
VRSDYTIKLNRKTLTLLTKEAYELYFGCKIGNQDEPSAPHIVCACCAVYLRGRLKGSQKYLPFALSMVWRAREEKIISQAIIFVDLR